jgi:hypothetical protein
LLHAEATDVFFQNPQISSAPTPQSPSSSLSNQPAIPSAESSPSLPSSPSTNHSSSSLSSFFSQNSLSLSNFTFLCHLLSYLHPAEQSDIFSRIGKTCRLNIEYYTKSLQFPSEIANSAGLNEGTRDSSFIPLSALLFMASDSGPKWKENERNIEIFYKNGLDSLIDRGELLTTPHPFPPLTSDKPSLPVD